MSSFFRDAEDAVADRTVDSVANDLIPGGSGKYYFLYNDVLIHIHIFTGFIGGTVATGVDQALNNDINRDLSGGFGSGGGGIF